MKKLLKIVAIVIVLIIIAVVVALFQIDRIARKAVEAGAGHALGVKTTLNDASVKVFRGESSISGLDVANPEGFKSDHFMTLGDAAVAVNLRSLMSSTVEVPTLTLDGLDINLEKRDGKANYGVIMANLAEFEKKLPPEGGKKFIIKDLTIRDVKVTVDLLPIGGSLTRQEVNIPEIHLTDVGSDTKKGVLVSQLSGVILKAVFASLVDKGVQLPGDVLKDLGKGLQGLASVSKYGLEISGQITSKALEITGEISKVVGEGVGKGLETGVKGVGKGVEGIEKGLGGLLGKDDKEKDEKGTND